MVTIEEMIDRIKEHNPASRIVVRCDTNMSDTAAWDELTTIKGWAMASAAPAPPVLHPTSVVEAARAAGAAEERARIRATLQELKPRVRKLTHGDWARGWREEGAAQLWAQIDKAIWGEE